MEEAACHTPAGFLEVLSGSGGNFDNLVCMNIIGNNSIV